MSNIDKLRKAQQKKGIDTKPKPTDPPKKRPTRRPITVGMAEIAAFNKPRLPDKAQYLKVYDATAKMWTGELWIHLQGFDYHVFRASESGSFRLEAMLDEQYRQWLKAKETPCASSAQPSDKTASPKTS